jgi:hypothetical protein
MMLTTLIRRHLWSAPERTPEEAAAQSERTHLRSVQVVRMFYVLSLLWPVQSMRSWPELRKSTAIDPLWPGEWIDLVGITVGISLILGFYLVATVAVAALPQLRVARIAYAFGLLQFMAIENGFGKVNHTYHAWFWVSAFLILLPGARQAWRPDATRDQRQLFLQVMMLAQMAVLFFYTLTGLWKVWYATLALFNDQVSAFEVQGFSLLIGKQLLGMNKATLAGDLLVANPWLGWVLFNGTMYLETVSLLILFRPRLHRAWGFGLILFHLGTQAAMSVLFPTNIVLVGLLLLCSPFAPERLDLKATILDLPGVHIVSRSRQRRSAGRQAPGEHAAAS